MALSRITDQAEHPARPREDGDEKRPSRQFGPRLPLRPDSFRSGLAAAGARRADREIRFVSAKTGRPSTGTFQIRLGRDCQRIPVPVKIDDRFQVRGPIGNAWPARFKAEGHGTIYLRGRLDKD